MKKHIVKVIIKSQEGEVDLENMINSQMEGKDVIDVKFSSCINKEGKPLFSAMIIYK